MKAVAILNFPKVGQLLMFFVLVVAFSCPCCFSAAKENCYRGSDLLDYANPCSDQPGQPARYNLCPKGQKLAERCTKRCDYCSGGTYQDAFTNCTTCLDCITAVDCPPGQVIIKNCTRSSNTVCGCPPSPPCPTCPSCPAVTPCPSITPCPIQTECPACECPTDVPVTIVTTDSQQPVVLTRECPADVDVVAASGSKVASVEWQEPQAMDGAIVVQSHHPGDSFVVGSSMVVYVFQLGSHTIHCSFSVTVVEGSWENCRSNPAVILLITSVLVLALLLLLLLMFCICWKKCSTNVAVMFNACWKKCPTNGFPTGQQPRQNFTQDQTEGHLPLHVTANNPSSAEEGRTEASSEARSIRDGDSLSAASLLSDAGGDSPIPTVQLRDSEVGRLTSTDQPLDIGLNTANPPPASANFSSDVANHSGYAVYSHYGDDDATDSTRLLLMPQTSSSTVPDDFDPAQLIRRDKVDVKVKEQEIRWLAAVVSLHFSRRYDNLYGHLGISANDISKSKQEHLPPNTNPSIESEVFAVVNYGWRDTENPIGEGKRSHLIKQLYTFDKNLAKTYAHFINNCIDFSIMDSTELLLG